MAKMVSIIRKASKDKVLLEKDSKTDSQRGIPVSPKTGAT